MEIIHRITAQLTPEMRRELLEVGISVPKKQQKHLADLYTFMMSESDAAWPAISVWLKKHNAAAIVRSTFSQSEISGARWAEVQATWAHGYPQPREDDFGYREVTYDLTDWCRECGTGMKQYAPFQMKKEPDWGSHSILQLHWVVEAFFVTPAAYHAVFEPFNVGSKEVMGPFRVPLKTVVQLVIDEEVDISTDGLKAATCKKCGIVKYDLIPIGEFPALLKEPEGNLVKSKQCFGFDHVALKGVLASHDLVAAIQNARLRGVTFRPVRSGVQTQGIAISGVDLIR